MAGDILAPAQEEVAPDLRLLGIGITNRCNLTCDFCSRSSGPWSHVDLSPDEIVTVVRSALSVVSGKLGVAITGGEPLLHPQFREIIQAVCALPVKVSLNSNGILLSRGIVDACRGAGVKNFEVSIEGPSRYYRVHEGSTKTYDAIAQNVAYLSKIGCSFNMGVTLSPRNLSYLSETAQLARDWGAKGLSLSRVYPIGRAIKNFNDLFIPFQAFLEAIEPVQEMDSDEFFVQVEDNAVRHHFDPDFRNRVEKDPASQAGGWGGCFAGVLIAHVEANGFVLTCPFMPLPAGNIRERSFADIWLNATVMRDMRRRDQLGGACGGCESKYSCGGCRGRAYGVYGDYYAEDPLCPQSAGGAERPPMRGGLEGGFVQLQLGRHGLRQAPEKHAAELSSG